ncbi:MAG: carbamoyltransferase C-terminal domain-containing protein [bacterium]|nr:carbamoyltransferase C-terminal domain-containing protein [bacterium]
MKILGIHYNHNATAALLEDGEIKFCQSEERISRLKNSVGFPAETVDYIFKNYGRNIDYVVISQKSALDYRIIKKQFKFKPVGLESLVGRSKQLRLYTLLRLFVYKVFNKSFVRFYFIRDWLINHFIDTAPLKQEVRSYFAETLNIAPSKIVFMDHHTAHALAPGFNLKNKTLIFTLDGYGDGLCGTVSIYNSGESDVLTQTDVSLSLGAFWADIARFLGMKPVEDEYKVMGLAPYARRNEAERIRDEFKKVLWLDKNNEFKSAFQTYLARFFYFDKFLYERFDNLAGGIQMFTEEIVTAWIEGWIKKTGIKNIALSGGIFMNVKLNQKIAEMDGVEEIFVMPSAGDESTVFGACLFGYKKYCEENKLPFKPQPFHNLYLGQYFTDDEIKKYINDNKISDKHKVEFYDNIEKKIAELLANNDIVARFKGAMEFGARALGNRSILAHPSHYDNVRTINRMIKSRDFWMPFAPSILEEDADKYIINPKKVQAPYMAITFNTTELGQEHLKAAIHLYDNTTRPQVVSKEHNSDYHRLISEFKKLTGIEAVLNTSFNLHGEPIVCSPEYAVRTFENSGLKYLALGNWLIEKH